MYKGILGASKTKFSEIESFYFISIYFLISTRFGWLDNN